MNKEHPILFSGPMVRAILEGRKTQTRRVVKTLPGEEFCDLNGLGKAVFTADEISYREVKNPYGDDGDRLWVRETFAHLDDLRTKDPGVYALQSRAFFRADHPTGLSHDDGKDLIWRPSIFMPRALSRIILEITDVRVERLHDISGADAKAEGVEPFLGEDSLAYRAAFQQGWDTINGKRAPWASNPWCWCVTFQRSASASALSTTEE